MTFGKKIESLRMDKKLSQKDLGVAIGVSTGKIAEWEADENSPTINEARQLSQVLGVTINEFFSESDEKDFEPQKTVQQPKIEKSKKKATKIIACVVMILILTIGIVFAWLFLQPFSENTNAMKRAEESVVKITCYDYAGNEVCTGSGFVIEDSHTIVTNYHVAEQAFSCRISTNQDYEFNVKDMISYSKVKDIAVLYVEEDTGLKPLKIGDDTYANKGDVVTAIGSPLGVKNSLSQGILSGRVYDNDLERLQFTAPISSGSSGGALFNEKGEVIGVTFASYIDGQNMNLAIPITSVISFHKAHLNNKNHYDLPAKHFFSNYSDVNRDSISASKNSIENINQGVIIDCYVSSYGKWSRTVEVAGTLLESSYDEMFFSSKNNITGDYKLDHETYFNNPKEAENMLQCTHYLQFFDNEYMPCDNLEVGDHVYAFVSGENKIVAVCKINDNIEE